MEDKSDIIKLANEKFTEFIMQRGLRKTPERFEVLKFVCLTTDIFTIDQLAKQIQEKGSFSISRATLFNTLEILVEAQMVIKHTMNHASHYECNIVPCLRTYLICRDCGSIKRQEDAQLRRYIATLKPRAFNVEQPVLYLYGLCRKCANMRKKKIEKSK